MRKHSLSLLAAVAVGLTASMASAADLPRKAPVYVPPAPPPITWTGCYIGGNIGWIGGRVSSDFNGGDEFFGNNDNHSSNSGFAGGGQIGCDYQWPGTGWVIGFRNMFDGTSLRRDRTIGTFENDLGDFSTGTIGLHTRVNWFDTLTGRIGYSFAPGWLLYGQGGGAWANAEANLTFSNAFATFASGGQSRTRSGWTAGGGIEWMFAPHWSAFLEGNYMDLGHKSVTVFGDPASTSFCSVGCTFNPKFTATTVLVGVNYRFSGFGAPY
jgi:outer membrane immunogenic protein